MKSGVVKLLVVLVLMAVFVVGCSVLLTRRGNEGGGAGGGEAGGGSTITFAQFQAVKFGATREAVEQTLGEAIEAQVLVDQGILPPEPGEAQCIYYKSDNIMFGEYYEFCFEAGKLRSKNSL